ncbi:hypothetical protein ACJQWK_00844 [Exserohilum turcicum]
MIVVALLVLFPLCLGLLGAYYGYRRYVQRRGQVHDEERMRDVRDDDGTEVQDGGRADKRYHGSQWYRDGDNVSANPASIDKTVASNARVNKSGGEGVINVPEAVYLNVEGKEKEQERPQRRDSQPDEQRRDSGSWDWEKDGYGNSTIQKAKVVTLTTSGSMRRKPAVQGVDKIYDATQPVALEIWNKINNRELQPLRPKAQEAVEQIDEAVLDTAVDYRVPDERRKVADPGDSNKHTTPV